MNTKVLSTYLGNWSRVHKDVAVKVDVYFCCYIFILGVESNSYSIQQMTFKNVELWLIKSITALLSNRWSQGSNCLYGCRNHSLTTQMFSEIVVYNFVKEKFLFFLRLHRLHSLLYRSGDKRPTSLWSYNQMITCRAGFYFRGMS